jgi:hypothetical protein
MNRIPLFLTALLACGLIAAGCGGDDDDDGDDSVATTETAPAATTRSELNEAALAGDSGAECMLHVEDQIDLHEQIGSEVPDDFRSQLEATCDGVTSPEGLVAALREQCKVVANETLAGDEAALKGCEDIKQP